MAGKNLYPKNPTNMPSSGGGPGGRAPVQKYPARDYTPLYPLGMDSEKKPPTDGGGKGNVAPARTDGQTPRKGQNPKSYEGVDPDKNDTIKDKSY